jgi:hypothetical protein
MPQVAQIRKVVGVDTEAIIAVVAALPDVQSDAGNYQRGCLAITARTISAAPRLH